MGLRYSQCLDPDGVDNDFPDHPIHSKQVFCAHPCYDGLGYGSSEVEDDDDDCDTGSRFPVFYARGPTTRFLYSHSPRFMAASSSLSRSKPLFRKTSKYNKNGIAITYGCGQCLTHLSSSNQIISDQYTGKTGDALLINSVVNVVLGEPEVREMTSGLYTVCDIKCHQCHKLLGWKYIKSHQASQKFKEQRYILEINNMKVVA
ncbi:hypothetical protein KL921_001418 [Ogataea angusta]|uniref:Yippee domain-containing protein n=1 Tax=Pichia angusta TaxID=870730 RepID=A0AAN6DHV4_PICAN|nr:uncharacterized protein KL928_002655 [Ogataea angusta]KAG7812186.1 hypothetical protein KL921_001418 [Ogataea angusta]KAG7818787.1 hypothetical protein KL928_002655 [Ogataea angusta]KAG7825034.1 hypothetical protein KL909_001326 [Ogataea angusta]KAG7834648.1 hypothetical protein KL943_003032 [Ogataea angusta]KAG7841674.1 hypothetical protein KL942_001553 [Ogataea angusta]